MTAIAHQYWLCNIATSIKDLQEIESLSNKFNLPQELIENVVTFLTKHDYVKEEKGKVIFKNPPTYTSKDSMLVPIHHNSWRQKAYLDSLQFQKDSLHYTMVQSISKTDFLRIKDLVLRTIEDYEKIAAPSDCEEMINFNIDVYRI